MTRFELRKEDHPEGNRWYVFDLQRGEPADVDGAVHRDLPLDDAEELADALNYLQEREPALVLDMRELAPA